MMLKAKKVINISENARSFYLASKKVGVADTTPSTCAEDEKHSTKRIYSLNDGRSNPASRKEQSHSSVFRDAGKATQYFPAGNYIHPSPPYVSHLHPSRHPHGSVTSNHIEISGLDTVWSSKSLAVEDIDTGVSSLSLSCNFKKGKFPSASGSDLQVTALSQAHKAPSISKPESSAWISDEWSKKAVAGFSSKGIQPSLNSSSNRSETERTVPKKSKGKISDVPAHDYNHDHGHGMYIGFDKLCAKASSSSDWEEDNMVASDGDKLKCPGNFVSNKGFTSKSRNPIQLFSKKLKELQWSSGAVLALNNLNCRLNPFQANQVLKGIRDHSLALEFFNWLKSQRGFVHDQHTYTTMIGVLGQARQFDSAMQLLGEMVRNGCQPNAVTYNRLINSYGRANYIREAMEVFHRMQNEGCKPDQVTFSTLIDVSAKAGYLELAMGLYQQMLQAGLPPDSFTYCVMIDCLGKAGYLVDACDLFREMIANGCTPNLVTYNVMIKMQAKARNHLSALRLYQSMRDAGFQPDKVTYSIVMETLGRCGRLEEVEVVFEEMMRWGDCIPDEPVYGLLVDLWGKAGNPDKALAWYEAMLDRGLKPNVPTCNSLLGAFLMVEKFSKAHDVLLNMFEMGLEPSLQTYTLLLSCCTEAKSHLKPCGELMAFTGHPAHLFLESLPNADPDGANVRNHVAAFLDAMHCEDRESKRGIVDAIVDFLHKSGLKEEACWVWDTAASRNLYPDAIREKWRGYWLIDLHVMSDGTALAALARSLLWLRKLMLETGCGPERVDIVTGWGKRSKVTGTSSVRQAVKDLLGIFEFPLHCQKGNSGCFVGCGMSLRAWLYQPYVERMHLL